MPRNKKTIETAGNGTDKVPSIAYSAEWKNDIR